MNIDRQIGGNLRRIREDKRITQRDAAEIIGVKHAAYSHRETGETPFKASEIYTLSRYFKTPIGYIYGEAVETSEELQQEERDMLDAYRKCSPTDRLTVFRVAMKAAYINK